MGLLQETIFNKMAERWDPKPSDRYWNGQNANTEGLFRNVRQRVAPGLFNDVDRQWRKRFMDTQKLSAKEKSMHFYYLWDNPDFIKARLNPLRRVWQAPGNALEHALRPFMGLQPAFVTRYSLGLFAKSSVAVWGIAYYCMFVGDDWKTIGGWKSKTSKPPTLPSDSNYPRRNPDYERSKPDHYFAQGGFYKDSVAAQLQPSTPVKHFG